MGHIQQGINGLQVLAMHALAPIIRKNAIIILALYLLAGFDRAKALPGRFSIECAPTLSINRIYCSDVGKGKIVNQGTALRMHFGVAYHFPLQTHCSLSTGLSYALGHMGIRRSQHDMPPINEAYHLHAIWMPILCRLHTSEVRIDTSIYFKLGIIPSISLPKRPISPLKPSEKPFVAIRPINCLILLGGGIQYDFSLNNSLAVGLSYCGDITGIMYKNDPPTKVYGHNDFVCLDFCLLF